MPLRPYVTLKIATSLDGKIALANGDSEWITGKKSREAGHRLRGHHDAIAIGSNTALVDNPQLTTRIEGLPDPVRVVFDSGLRLPLNSNLVSTARNTPVWVFCAQQASEKSKALEEAGVKVFGIDIEASGLKISTALDVLKSNGVDRLLVEGGGQIAASFLKLDVVDAIEWFRAPIILGGDAKDGVGALGFGDLSFVKKFSRSTVSVLGDDVHEQYLKA